MKPIKVTWEIRLLMDEIRKLSRRITHEIRMNDGCTDEYIKQLQAEYAAKLEEYNRTVEYV
jgi:hypothetical protein